MSDNESEPKKKPDKPYDYWNDPEHTPMPDMSEVARLCPAAQSF